MLETDIYIYYAFGYNYNILRNGAAALSVRGEENSLESILENFFTRLVDLKLQVTEQAASDLAQIYERVKAMQEAVTVDSKLAAEIRNACNKIDTTLDAELQLRTAFIVSPKRFDLHHLLEKPGSLLSEEARSR